jgi:hypothetical protein
LLQSRKNEQISSFHRGRTTLRRFPASRSMITHSHSTTIFAPNNCIGRSIF